MSTSFARSAALCDIRPTNKSKIGPITVKIRRSEEINHKCHKDGCSFHFKWNYYAPSLVDSTTGLYLSAFLHGADDELRPFTVYLTRFQFQRFKFELKIKEEWFLSGGFFSETRASPEKSTDEINEEKKLKGPRWSMPTPDERYLFTLST